MAGMGFKTQSAPKNDIPKGGVGVNDGQLTHVPRFMPSDLTDLQPCKSQEDLDKVKANLANLRKMAALTKQKFSAQMAAADLALEMIKSQNRMVAYWAKVALQGAKDDAELASLLQAIPGMVGAINGQISQKAEQKKKSFVDRLNAAGKGKSEKK
jgi:hypothetical protein